MSVQCVECLCSTMSVQSVLSVCVLLRLQIACLRTVSYMYFETVELSRLCHCSGTSANIITVLVQMTGLSLFRYKCQDCDTVPVQEPRL